MKKQQCLAVIVLLALPSVIMAAETTYEWKDGRWQAIVAPGRGSPAGELELIRFYSEKKAWPDVISEAERFCNLYPDNPDCQEAMMLAGQAEIGRERYFQAYEWFEKLLNKFSNGTYSERALLREFHCAEQFLAGKKRRLWGGLKVSAEDDGLEILSRIAEHVPGTELAEKALLRIGEYYYSKREYLEAADAYDRYVQLFPKSAKAEFATLQAALATYSSYRGSQFDEAPLIEGEQRLKTFRERYPAAAERANLAATLSQIRIQRAQRTYDVASFYKRTGHGQAAAFYYREVVKNYPDTPLAATARQYLNDLHRATMPATAPSGEARPPAASTAPTDLSGMAPATGPGRAK